MWILGQCQHDRKKIDGVWLNQGQCYTTLRRISNVLKYQEGKNHGEIAPARIKNVLKEFREEKMIKMVKHEDQQKDGFIITVLKYAEYQNPASYRKTPLYLSAKEQIQQKENIREANKNREKLLVNYIERYWTLHLNGDKESCERLEQDIRGMAKEKDLPKDSVKTLREVIKYRKART